MRVKLISVCDPLERSWTAVPAFREDESGNLYVSTSKGPKKLHLSEHSCWCTSLAGHIFDGKKCVFCGYIKAN